MLYCTVPQAPSSIKAVVAGANSIVVAWSLPGRTHGVITKYLLYIRAPPERDPIRRILPPQNRWLEVTDLEPRMRYEFWVAAATRVGEGPASPVVSATPTDTVGAGIHSVGGDVRAAKGTDVILVCPHVGEPEPTITWRRNNAPVTRETRYELQPDGGLLLRDCQRADSGNYTCHASNRHGSDHILYTLAVIGPGAASDVITVRTKGNRPASPPQHRLVAVNASAATIRLSSWADKHCPITAFVVKLRPSTSREWQIVSGRLPGKQAEYTMGDLMPSTPYELSLTATNPAGDTTTTYSFTTHRIMGDRLQEGMGPIGGGMLGSPGGRGPSPEDVFTDPAFIVPIVISCIALVSIIIAITLCLKRRPITGHEGGGQGEEGDPSLNPAAENKSNLAAREQYYATVRKPAPSPIHDVNALERIPEYAEDIYPYATFQIQRQEDSISTHFQTFVYQDPRRATVETLAYRKVRVEVTGMAREEVEEKAAVEEVVVEAEQEEEEVEVEEEHLVWEERVEDKEEEEEVVEVEEEVE
ncbi:Down syndrome cell adhesion molecule-like protein Dscam2 [Portunus trituberculatus]|uniref:Down syndrome cell adhesion molecule-like protein Dscam2 n=1 Tax=Portunus trituberculatus TaxID=210409 RepID=A0A5B7FX10_PORTR|nr:Down syndrome cell adhesion molecule-like protein Dscam2 [Portunus trituberculatus]